MVQTPLMGGVWTMPLLTDPPPPDSQSTFKKNSLFKKPVPAPSSPPTGPWGSFTPPSPALSWQQRGALPAVVAVCHWARQPEYPPQRHQPPGSGAGPHPWLCPGGGGLQPRLAADLPCGSDPRHSLHIAHFHVETHYKAKGICTHIKAHPRAGTPTEADFGSVAAEPNFCRFQRFCWEKPETFQRKTGNLLGTNKLLNFIWKN